MTSNLTTLKRHHHVSMTLKVNHNLHNNLYLQGFLSPNQSLNTRVLWIFLNNSNHLPKIQYQQEDYKAKKMAVCTLEKETKKKLENKLIKWTYFQLKNKSKEIIYLKLITTLKRTKIALRILFSISNLIRGEDFLKDSASQKS